MPCHLICTMQVGGNPCPQQLPPALLLEAPQRSCRLRHLLPKMIRNRGSVPAHPMNERFPGPDPAPENLALALKGQIVQKALMKKRILPLLLKPSSSSSAPQWRSQSHAHLQTAGSFRAQLHRLDDLHPSLHPERSCQGVLGVCIAHLKGTIDL